MKPFVPNKNLKWYENEKTFNGDINPKRVDSASSNESSSSLVADNAKHLNRSTRTLLDNSDQSLN